MRKLELLMFGLVASAFLVSPAWAGIIPPATPGPLLGAGIPALAGLAYFYRRIRKARDE